MQRQALILLQHLTFISGQIIQMENQQRNGRVTLWCGPNGPNGHLISTTGAGYTFFPSTQRTASQMYYKLHHKTVLKKFKKLLSLTTMEQN